jgi:hypothetical protein
LRRIAAVVATAWLAFFLSSDSALAAGLDRTAKFAPRFGEATFDVLVLRPMSAVALVVGSVFFVASVPLVLPFEGVQPSWSTFVYAPYEYTVLRSLGDF